MVAFGQPRSPTCHRPTRPMLSRIGATLMMSWAGPMWTSIIISRLIFEKIALSLGGSLIFSAKRLK
jgi:hypothetical protein